MKIRPVISNDLSQIRQLFYDTVTTINAKDYTPEQITEWASVSRNIDNWTKKIKEQHFFVAEIEEEIVGFCSMTASGQIDFMYVHKDHQGQQLASKLLIRLEELAKKLNLDELWSDVSITAKPFFEHMGFSVTKVYTKKMNEIEFTNSIMTKSLK